MRLVPSFLINFAKNLSNRDTLPLVGAVGLLIILEGLITFPQLWWLWVALSLIATLLVGILLTNFNTPVPGWWHTLFSPILFVLSSISLILFLDTVIARHLVIVATIALLALFWENIRRYYWDLKNYHAESLENVSLGINIFIVWFTSSALYYLLLDPSVVQKYSSAIIPVASLIMVLVVYFIDYRTIWVQRYSPKKVWLLLIAQSIIVSELFWILNFWPNSIQVKSFVIALAYYFLVSLGRAHLDNTLNSKVLRRYVYYGLTFLLAVFLTARWLV